MEGLLGLVGGALFLSSWIYQAWETKRAQQAVVSFQFFAIRLLASILLVVEAVRVRSYGFMLVVGGTIFLILYNMYVIKFKRSVPAPTLLDGQ